MPSTRIVALAGMTKSGKTLCSSYITENYGLRHHAFVDHFKHSLQELHPELTERDLWGPGREEHKDFLGGKTVREALIELSTKERAEHKGCAIARLSQKIAAHPTAPGWVLSDCRHETEVDWCLRHAITIKLLRGARRLLQSNNTKHFDWHVINRPIPLVIDNENLEIPELYARIDAILMKHGLQKTRT